MFHKIFIERAGPSDLLKNPQIPSDARLYHRRPRNGLEKWGERLLIVPDHVARATAFQKLFAAVSVFAIASLSARYFRLAEKFPVLTRYRSPFLEIFAGLGGLLGTTTGVALVATAGVRLFKYGEKRNPVFQLITQALQEVERNEHKERFVQAQIKDLPWGTYGPWIPEFLPLIGPVRTLDLLSLGHKHGTNLDLSGRRLTPEHLSGLQAALKKVKAKLGYNFGLSAVKTLDLSNTQLDSDALQAAIDLMSLFPALTDLKLDGHTLSREHQAALGKVRNHCDLEQLSLNNCVISWNCLQAVCSVIRSNSGSCQALRLRQTPLDQESVGVLARHMQSLRRCSSVLFDLTGAIDHEAAAYSIGQALRKTAKNITLEPLGSTEKAASIMSYTKRPDQDEQTPFQVILGFENERLSVAFFRGFLGFQADSDEVSPSTSESVSYAKLRNISLDLELSQQDCDSSLYAAYQKYSNVDGDDVDSDEDDGVDV